MNEIKFYGIDILKYYYYLYQNSYADYSWQTKIAYFIVICSLLLLFLMLLYFIYKFYKKKKYTKKQNEVIEQYNDIIESLLINEELEHEYIINTLSDIDKSIKAEYFIKVLINIRLKYQDKEYFKNMQLICKELGIVEYIENNLLTKYDIFKTLQCLVMLQIEIAEGRLANYINYKNKHIRSFARIAYMYCSRNEPYKFLYDELEEQQNAFTSMLLHYVFSWMNIQDKVLPNFIQYVKTLKNDSMSAFMLNEMQFYNQYITKNDVIYFFDNSTNKLKTKETIVKLSKKLNYNDISPILLNLYYEQTEDIKKEIIKTLSYSGKEKSIDILVNLYKNSISKVTKETILTELISLNKEGINAFKNLSVDASKDASLFSNIESLMALDSLKKFYIEENKF